MPHSSGGGSHSGGSHGGRSNSSGGGSHRGGSHGGGSGGGYDNPSPLTNKTSTSYFEGSHRFVRYRHGKPEYVYGKSKVSPSAIQNDFIKSILRVVLFLLFYPASLCVFVLKPIITDFFSPKYLANDFDKTGIIEDTIDVISGKEEEDIIVAATNFANKSGIPIHIITVENSEWIDNYDSLENYAYDLYVNRYPDEAHWVIVYSTDTSRTDFDDWHFEGMQGDYTDKILTEDVTMSFNNDLQKLLTQKNVTVGTAFATALNNVTKYTFSTEAIVTDKIVNIIIIVGLLIPIIAFLICLYFVMKPYKSKVGDYVPCPGKATDDIHTIEANCEYCGGLYIRGTVLKCPHCGAPIQASTTA